MPVRPATFSIVARDPTQEAIGIAVQSKFVSVGSVVPFAAADAGGIATQSYANVAYGPDGLDRLREGAEADTVIDELTEADPDAESRQVGIVGQDGSVAAFTGEECHDYAGDRQGDQYTVQGNILEGPDTLDAMAEAFESTDGGLPERMLAALKAGNAAGGDKRGEQSAAMYVVKPAGGYDGRNDRWIDVRVDDHEHPIEELQRIFRIYDVTLLERTEPEELRELSGPNAESILSILADLGHYEGEPGRDVGEAERDALESFRGMNNFENHSLAVIEDALLRGYDDAEGDGAEKLVNAIWHGLSRLERA